MVWYCTVRYQLLFNHLHNLLAGIAIVELRKSYKEHGEELRHKVSKWKVYFTKITSLVWLTLSWWRQLSCRNQSIDLRSKSMDWFLYNNGLCHERANYMFDRWPKTKINLPFSSWLELVCRKAQGWVFLIILLKIDLGNVSFCLLCYICYFNDKTPYVCQKSFGYVLEILEEHFA